jgi:hypothetical protein
MKYVRKLTAPISAVFLILIAILAFSHLQAGTEYPPPILDPQFGLWVSDSNFGGQKPMVWELEYQKGPGDQILLQETTVGNKSALEIRIYQDGIDDRWAYVRLAQTIDGTRLQALLDEEVAIWVFLQASCECRGEWPNQTSIFEVQIGDGAHTLDFIFSDAEAEMNQSPTHRTVLLQSPSDEWVRYPIDLGKQYKAAQWELPDRISFSIILGASALATGWHAVDVNGFSVTKKTLINPTKQQQPSFAAHSTIPYAVSHRLDESLPSFQDKHLSSKTFKPIGIETVRRV